MKLRTTSLLSGGFLTGALLFILPAWAGSMTIQDFAGCAGLSITCLIFGAFCMLFNQLVDDNNRKGLL